MENTEIEKDIALRIYHFRNKANLSARELSIKLNKHNAYINKLESNNFNITVSTLFEILEILNVSPQEFFADNYKTYALDNELINVINNLSPDKKAKLLSFLK